MMQCVEKNGEWVCETFVGTDLDYWRDWAADDLADGESISLSEWDAPASLGAHDDLTYQGRCRVFLAPTVAGRFTVTNTITTDSTPPRQFVHKFILNVK